MKKGLYAGILLFLFLACKNDKVVQNNSAPTTVKVEVIPTWNGQGISMSDTVTTSEGYKIKFTNIKFYISQWMNDGEQLVEAALFDWSNGNVLVDQEGTPEKFTSMNCQLGVDASLNHNDPSAFPNESPLNIVIADDMHWDWNPGYIFVKVEAKVDTIPDLVNQLDHTLVYHIGRDENIRTLDLPELNWNQIGSVHSAELNLDLTTFMTSDPIDVKTEFTSHTGPGQEALSTKVMDNFKAAIKQF